jgi:hypothetical protein
MADLLKAVGGGTKPFLIDLTDTDDACVLCATEAVGKPPSRHARGLKPTFIYLAKGLTVKRILARDGHETRRAPRGARPRLCC